MNIMCITGIDVFPPVANSCDLGDERGSIASFVASAVLTLYPSIGSSLSPTAAGALRTSIILENVQEIRPHVPVAALCRQRALRALDRFQIFPQSYNQILVRGVLDYCQGVLGGMADGNAAQASLLLQIRRLTDQIEALWRQFAGQQSVNSFALLDLAGIEDKFQLLQDEAAKVGVARLDQIPTAALIER